MRAGPRTDFPGAAGESDGAARAALAALARTVLRLHTVLDPANAMFARVLCAETLERAGDDKGARALREEILTEAPAEIERRFDAVRRFSPHTPQHEVDTNRLACDQALLCYGSVLPKLAEQKAGTGETGAARELYVRGLDFLAGMSRVAAEIDERRRTFETLATVFASLHARLSGLLLGTGEIGGAMFHIEEALRSRHSDYPEAWELLGSVVDRYEGDGLEELRAAADVYTGDEIPPMAFPVTRCGLVRNARKWFAAIEAAPPPEMPDRPHRILVAAFDLHRLQFLLALSCVLVWRGHAVDFVYLPSIRFVRTVEPEPDYGDWDERFLAAEMQRVATLNSSEKLSFFDLREEASEPVDGEMEAACRRQATADAEHLAARSQDIERVRFRLNLYTAERLGPFIERRRPDAAIVYNGGVMEYGTAFHVARRADVPVICFDAAADGCVLSQNRPCGDPETPQPTGRNAEPERSVGDVRWNQAVLDFPWSCDDFLASIETGWSMERVLSPEGVAAYGETFGVFAGNNPETNGQ